MLDWFAAGNFVEQVGRFAQKEFFVDKVIVMVFVVVGFVVVSFVVVGFVVVGFVVVVQ